MLKKLLKYDIRYIYKIFLVTIIAIFAVGALTGAAFGGMFEIAFTMDDVVSDAQIVFYVFTLMFLYFAGIIGIVVLAALPSICVLVLYYRFYRNLYTDQGYLSFTLPVKPTDHLHSKLIVSGTTMVILDLFMVLGGVLAICIAFLICQEAFKSLLEEFGLAQLLNKDNLEFLLENIRKNFDAVAELITCLIVSIIANLVTHFANISLVFFDITFACSIVKKHKLLASIGMYLAVNTVIGGIVYVVNMLVSMFGSLLLPGIWGTIVTLIVSILLYTIIGIVSYCLNRHYMTKKLNLQ